MACTCDSMEFTPAELRFCNSLTGIPGFDVGSSACCSDSASSFPLAHATSSNLLVGACLPSKPVSTSWDADFAASVCSGKPWHDAPTREPSVEPQPRTRWADIDSDDELDISSGALVQDHKLEDVKGLARQGWADMQSDEEKETNAQPLKSNEAEASQTLLSRPRWADLQSDDDEDAAPPSDAVKTREPDENRQAFAHAQSDQDRPLDQPIKRIQAAKFNGDVDAGLKSASVSKLQFESKKTWQQPILKPAQQNRKLKNAGHSQNQARQGWDQQTDAKPDKRRGRRQADNKKFQCQFTIGIEEEPKFRVVRKVLGPAGKHMKDIAEQTGAKMRLRGRGSKFLEGAEQQESTDPLMLCVSVHGQWAYDEAIQQISKLLQRVYQEYDLFCRKAGNAEPRLQVQMHKGFREGSR